MPHLNPKTMNQDTTKSLELGQMYERVKPLVEKMKAKYPQDLEGLEPALTSDIAEIVLEVLAAETLKAREEVEQKYADIFAWLLGEKGDFPNVTDKPHYSFRTELRKRLSTLSEGGEDNQK